MGNLRRQFALRLLGEKVNPAYRREVPGEAQKDSPKGRATPRGARVSVKPGAKIVRSACYSCNMCCEVLVFVEEATG